MKKILFFAIVFLFYITVASAVVCTDSDGANNFHQAGVVELGGRVYVDFCEGNTAIDYGCSTEYTQKYTRYSAQKSEKECYSSCIDGSCAGSSGVRARSSAPNSVTGNAIGGVSDLGNGQGGIVLVFFLVVAGLALYASVR